MSEKLIIISKKTIKQMSTKELLLELFKRDTGKTYTSQEEISVELFKKLKAERKQSAISKALKKIDGKEIVLDGMKYYFLKTDEGYRFVLKGCMLVEAEEAFAKRKVFESYEPYVVSKKIIAYVVKEKHREYVRDYIRKIFEDDSFFDIIFNGNKIYFLISERKNIFNEMCDIPRDTEAIFKQLIK